MWRLHTHTPCIGMCTCVSLAMIKIQNVRKSTRNRSLTHNSHGCIHYLQRRIVDEYSYANLEPVAHKLRRQRRRRRRIKTHHCDASDDAMRRFVVDSIRVQTKGSIMLHVCPMFHYLISHITTHTHLPARDNGNCSSLSVSAILELSPRKCQSITVANECDINSNTKCEQS